MPHDTGTSRDIAVIRAVREEIGADAMLMLDANNGYNLTITKDVLAATADCRIHWMEEAFHEDAVLYRDLKDWLGREGLATLIGDGEGDASPHLMDWAREGIVDVVQYDIVSHGLNRWLETSRQLDAWGRSTAPHHYGTGFGNYAAGHLAAAVTHFQFVEWDHADIPGLVTDAYTIDEGHVVIPQAPGFGLALDETVFATAVASGGFELSA
jgi:L-alanine-DL-glutamate epimerase-like enolase superfamily enzyme